jgi:hypothetical protein
MRVPLADGTLVATPEVPEADVVPDFLAASNVLGTGWFGAVAAEAGPGKTVAVVGDGAVGLLGMMAAQQLGAEQSVWSPVSPALGTASVWSPVSPALGVRRPSMPAMRAASASCWHTARSRRRTRHTSLASLAIYAKPTFDAVAAATAALDPDRRR